MHLKPAQAVEQSQSGDQGGEVQEVVGQGLLFIDLRDQVGCPNVEKVAGSKSDEVIGIDLEADGRRLFIKLCLLT